MNWEGITIHHSASPDVSANEIDRWHKERGWKGIGYHFVIRKNGAIELGRNINSVGAHNRGKNGSHIGICATGHFGKEPPSIEQIDSIIRLCKGICNKYNIKDISGHHDNCPGLFFPLKFTIKNIKE